MKLLSPDTAPTDGTPFLGYGYIEWNSFPKPEIDDTPEYTICVWDSLGPTDDPKDLGFRTRTHNPYDDYCPTIGLVAANRS